MYHDSLNVNMGSYRLNSVIIYAILVVTLGCHSRTVYTYIFPEPTFEVLKPQGLHVSIPDESGIQFFAFHANVNKRISSSQDGEISGQTFRAGNGKWTVEDAQVNLQDGDVINYWMYVQVAGSSFTKEDQTWTVISHPQGGETTSTPLYVTSNAAVTYEGRLVLDENFNSLNESLWSRDVKMPLAPDYEFCVYHNENHQLLIQVNDGILRIQPLILEDYYGENATAYGRLQLSGCTSNIAAECSRRAVSYSILPPIISGRLNTKYSFNFRYGKIEVRAKFPEGDWLYPEMWLEPRYENYGPAYASGRALLGLSRGNENLMNMNSKSIFDSRRLEFGLRVGSTTNISEYIVSKVHEGGPRWTQDFHVYTTIWTAEGFQFLVDGQEVGSLSPGTNSWLQDGAYTGAKRSAPFDGEFYITLGVGVGGVRVFPDSTMSSGYAKPWKNLGVKAMLKFWHSRNNWLPSWRRNEGRRTAFEIDYVRVWAF